MKIKCEQCGKHLVNLNDNDNRHMIASQAKREGVHVKNWIFRGDDSGYHYFCNKQCSKAWLISQGKHDGVNFVNT